MDGAPRAKTVMFVTGPVKKVEDELATLTEEWAAVEFSYHVIADQACVTVRLIPAVILRQMQYMASMQPNHRLRG